MKKLVNVLCAAALGIGIGVACGGSPKAPAAPVAAEGGGTGDANPCAPDKVETPEAGGAKAYGGSSYGK
jgi:hypothetical protein